MNELYPTSEAARILDVNPSTIRTWKSRQSDRFLESTHFIKGEAGILWTEAGLEELRRCGSQGETKAVSVSPTESEGGILERYDTLLDQIADAIAPRLMDKLDEKVTQRLVTISCKPVDAVATLQALGLKPANLNLLGAASDE